MKIEASQGDEVKAGRANTMEMSAEKLEQRVMQPAGCRSYMRRRLASVFPEIVDGFVEAAKKGSCPHVKLATELLAPTRKGASRKKDSVAQLLEELGAD
jgi:hypothetical protein